MDPEYNPETCNCGKLAEYAVTPNTADGTIKNKTRYACADGVLGIALSLSLDIRGVTGVYIKNVFSGAVLYEPMPDFKNVYRRVAKVNLGLQYGNCVDYDQVAIGLSDST